jgi:hypothetical protein
MATHKTQVRRLSNDDAPRSPVTRPAAPAFRLPPKLDRVIPQNEQPHARSVTAVDGAGQQAAGAHDNDTPAVRVIELPAKREPSLKLAVSIDLSANPGGIVGGYQKLSVQGNVVLYADSTNGTDRMQLKYALTDGDQTAPARSMVPGRVRREARFNFIYVTWTATAGATATLEVYDDPDNQLDIR